MVNLLAPPDDVHFLKTAHDIYVQHQKFPEALSLSLRLSDPDLIREDFNAPANPLMKRQLAFMIARAQIPLEWLQPPREEGAEGEDEDVDFQDELPEDLMECLSNLRLSKHFKSELQEMRLSLNLFLLPISSDLMIYIGRTLCKTLMVSVC